jgi:hypothetical protein
VNADYNDIQGVILDKDDGAVEVVNVGDGEVFEIHEPSAAKRGYVGRHDGVLARRGGRWFGSCGDGSAPHPTFASVAAVREGSEAAGKSVGHEFPEGQSLTGGVTEHHVQGRAIHEREAGSSDSDLWRIAGAAFARSRGGGIVGNVGVGLTLARLAATTAAASGLGRRGGGVGNVGIGRTLAGWTVAAAAASVGRRRASVGGNDGGGDEHWRL